MSSNTALQKVRRALGAAKAGHAGTLDPLATGMLPVLLGEATKIAGHLLGRDKAYRVEARLGVTTDSYDADGNVTGGGPVPVLTDADLRPVLAALTGAIRQRPPAYSALKQGGVPLYRRARRGEVVDVPERVVQVHDIAVLALDGDHLALDVVCGSGTYIRSLVHDIGQTLGCGAHVTALRRLWVDPFREQPMVQFDAVLAGTAPLLPVLAGLAGWPTLIAGPEQVLAIRQGRTVAFPGAGSGRLAVLAGADQLLALMEVGGDGTARSLRVFNPGP
ncbi:MAG: tRNA pseudouridine(55) synthase TruB [Xanthomonadales bacterium]|nr:tRNA pseudouridine(55) synthase TruB [Xanthomonadales bacterium]